MGRSPRWFWKECLYEIVSRVESGLPLPPTDTTNEILRGILGRVQRDAKVTLCNFVYMNNHSHIHAIPNEPSKFQAFYGEFQKKITDSVKALIGRKALNLWEDRAAPLLIDRLEDAIGSLQYIFSNPAAAGLVDSIDDYPGLSSWEAFISCPPSVDAEVSCTVRWYPVKSIPQLPHGRCLNPKRDKQMLNRLKEAEVSYEHTLTIQPFAWLAQYGVTEPGEIEAIRQRVISGVRAREEELRVGRRRKSVIGAERLRAQAYLAPHHPKERGRKIFLICSDKERRIELLAAFKATFARCRECYEQMKRGVPVVFPSGTFVPWLPPSTLAEFG